MAFDLFDKYGIDNCKIHLLELVNASSKDEMEASESYHIRTIKCVNKYIPLRSSDEYYQDNKEKLLQKEKEYHVMDKDKIDDYKKRYKSENTEKIKEKRKQGSIRNKINISGSGKLYYETNKDRIKEYKTEPITCECGCCVKRQELTRHKKTQKHVKLMNIKNQGLN
jgi:hypothetical protein